MASSVVQAVVRRSERTHLAVALLSVMLIGVACGDGPSATSVEGSASTLEASDPGGELAFGLQRCDPDAPRLEADPAFYRDEPIYVGEDLPIEEVRSWAATRPGYQDIWLDPDHNGWISLGFSENASARQAELEAEFPGVGVVAVEVPATDAELQAIRNDAEAALQGLSSWGLGHSVAQGMVEVTVPVLDEETLSRLAPLASPMLCVTGADPADAVPDGPQPTQGEGWRLLGSGPVGSPYRTGVATTAEQYAALWREAGLAGDGPELDFETEIAIWFGAVFGSSCPIRLDDVVVDADRRLVHGDFVLPGNPSFCTADANAQAYMVALARDRLPEAPFDVQLDADDPPSGVPEERTTVNVDLRPAGSTASAADLVVGFLSEDSIVPSLFEPGLFIELDHPWVVLVDLACSVDVLGPLNQTMWRATDEGLSVGPPAAWAQAANDGLVEAELLLTTSPTHLAVTANGVTVAYEPIPASEQAAMSCR